MASEADPGSRHCIDMRARVSGVAVAAQSVRAQCVNQNQEDVQIFAFCETRNISELPNRPRVNPRVERHVDGNHADRSQNVGPEGRALASHGVKGEDQAGQPRPWVLGRRATLQMAAN